MRQGVSVQKTLHIYTRVSADSQQYEQAALIENAELEDRLALLEGS